MLPRQPTLRPCLALIAAALPLLLSPERGAAQERFDYPTYGVDSFDFAGGGEWMSMEGDSLYGERVAEALPVANRIKVNVWVDQAPQACLAELDFYFDGAYLGQTKLAPVADRALIATPFLAIADEKLRNSTTHSLEIYLNNDIASCGEESGIRFLEEGSYISLDFVPSDADEDGFDSIPTLGEDCDDLDPAVNPEAEEVEDGIDNDCDAKVDEGTQGYDPDGDGVSEASGDCAPEDPDVYPGAPELVDGIDNDCDQSIDEGTSGGDDDGDGFSEDEGDCDDESIAIHPGTSELPDGLDNDCDDAIDEGLDPDGDGVIDGDCAPDDPHTYPGAMELDDGIDNDCDDVIDEDLNTTPTADATPSEGEGTPEEESPENAGCDCASQSQRGSDAPWMMGALLLLALGLRPGREG